jgi:ubiquinone/menaquinone biosynthesis C-methylase UbiE
VGVYGDRVLPRLIDKLMDNGDIRALRRQALEGISGAVLEIGFGSGLNVPLYPPEVTKVYAVDPATVGRKLAAGRIGESNIVVEFIGLDGEDIPLADATVDNAVSSFTLCTIPDESRALREVHRVLKPGGRLHFVEHGLSPDEKVTKWQHRIEPFNRRIFGGCHLTRAHDDALVAAGFTVDRIDKHYGKGPKPYVFHFIGTARKDAPVGSV